MEVVFKATHQPLYPRERKTEKGEPRRNSIPGPSRRTDCAIPTELCRPTNMESKGRKRRSVTGHRKRMFVVSIQDDISVSSFGIIHPDPSGEICQ